MKICPSAHKDIIEAYTIDLWPLQEIADVLHVSKTTVYKFLKKHGVDTSNHKIAVSCTTCGKSILRHRKRVRTQLNHFCSTDCYSSFLDAGKSSYSDSNRHQGRLASVVVSQHFDLQPGNIIHHEDRNRYNNKPYNLKVFANQGDHIKYHHQNRDKLKNKLTDEATKEHRKMWFRYNGIEIKPLWDGSTLC